jgi:hypothetical protein
MPIEPQHAALAAYLRTLFSTATQAVYAERTMPPKPAWPRIRSCAAEAEPTSATADEETSAHAAAMDKVRSRSAHVRSAERIPHILHCTARAQQPQIPCGWHWRATSPGLVPPQCMPARAGAVGGGGADRSGHRRVRPVLRPHEAAQRGEQRTRVPSARAGQHRLVLSMRCPAGR